MTDYVQRVKDCQRRAAVVYPHLLLARKRYRKLDRAWSYWMNRAYEAEKRTVEVNVIDSKLTRKDIDKFKVGAKKILQTLTSEQKKELLRDLQKGE